MWKRKWLIPAMLLPVLLIGGIAGGVAMAAGETDGTNQEVDRQQELLDRTCAVYLEKTGVSIDPEQLEAALNQARTEMHDKSLRDRLQRMVEEGRITQEEADAYLEWWQARPEIGLLQREVFGFRGDIMGGKFKHGLGRGYCTTG